MKMKKHEIIFNEADVEQFVKLIGDRNPIYQSLERAKDYGFERIPLPQAMPMMAYKWFETKWELPYSIIHRKQKCILHQRMYVDEIYHAIVEVTDQSKRHNLTFMKQILYLYNSDEKLCFEGISDLVLEDLS